MNTEELVKERGKDYGAPGPAFALIKEMAAHFEAFRNNQKQLPREKESAFRHVVYMILVKLSRLGVTPDHKDSWDDIKGYVECAESFIYENYESDIGPLELECE